MDCVLFDLDGTLLDTARDFAVALNEARRRRGLDELAFDAVRAVVSHGSLAMTRLACPAPEDSTEFARFRDELLSLYAAYPARHSTLFPGVAALLSACEQAALPWGIVTNKPDYLTQPLLRALALDERAAVVVSGDTAARAKPHPDPLLLAAERVGLAPAACVYIGDAERDIVAGRSAGMRTLAATWGYLAPADTSATWGADALVHDAADIARWLGLD